MSNLKGAFKLTDPSEIAGRRVVVVDDVLTTGKHYKCCERRLREVLADIPIGGLFVARRVLARRRCRAPPPIQAGSARALTVP